MWNSGKKSVANHFPQIGDTLRGVRRTDPALKSPQLNTPAITLEKFSFAGQRKRNRKFLRTAQSKCRNAIPNRSDVSATFLQRLQRQPYAKQGRLLIVPPMRIRNPPPFDDVGSMLACFSSKNYPTSIRDGRMTIVEFEGMTKMVVVSDRLEDGLSQCAFV